MESTHVGVLTLLSKCFIGVISAAATSRGNLGLCTVWPIDALMPQQLQQ